MSWHDAGTFLAAYARARRVDRLTSTSRLEALQSRWLQQFLRQVTAESPFYRGLRQVPFGEWPVMTKSSWMAQFDTINTLGAPLAEVSRIALEAEGTRDFRASWRGITVGLSTGTSGSRGIFLVSGRERAQWAGTLLAKLLRGGLASRERVAFVFRAGGPLYDTVGALRVTFRFFDQSRRWTDLCEEVRVFAPTVLVAPARTLRLLGETESRLRPKRVISVAEVLDDLDRAALERRFGVPIEQIYQATEGLLGISCEHGTIHLNEPFLLVEREWQDAAHSRFVPIVTDLWRRSQPVIRYRLNDVLRLRATPCPCGRAATALEAVDGRLDDVLWLRGTNGTDVPVFPDLLTRLIVRTVAPLEDFELAEHERGAWVIRLRPTVAGADARHLVDECTRLARSLGAEPPSIELEEMALVPASGKQRRVRGAPTCVS